MPVGTATPERIRRIRRESEFARFSDPAVLVSYPRAQDGFEDVRESFFDNVADAQVLVNELATILCTAPRRHEAAELSDLVKLGDEIPLTPTVPRARMVDKLSQLDRTMPIKGFSVDFQTERNSVEAIG